MAAPKGNKYAIGNHGGAPAHYETPDELRAQVMAYFQWCDGEFHEEEKTVKNKKTNTENKETVKIWDRYPERLTVTGLSLFLGFASRSSLDDYEKRSDEFSYIIKRARTIVENGYENRLSSDVPGSATGAIFALKNMGWSDKQEVDFNGHMNTDVDYSKFSDATLAEIAAARSK